MATPQLKTKVTSNSENRVLPQLELIESYSRNLFSLNTLKYFNSLGDKFHAYRKRMDAYITHTVNFLTAVVPEGKKVLLVGATDGKILAALNPSLGVGLSLSPKLTLACTEENEHPNVKYVSATSENYAGADKFDYIVLLNMVEHCGDSTLLFKSLKKFCHSETRVVVAMLNPLWHPLLKIASKVGIRIPNYEMNLVPNRFVCSALEVNDFRLSGTHRRVLVPKRIPLVSWFTNQFVSRLPFLNLFCFSQYLIAIPNFSENREPKYSVSVIVPCYNEEGNVEECVRRVPKMGKFTEVVVVNDGSKDRTAEIAEGLKGKYPQLTLITYGKNQGKGKAVLEGMRQAKGDILMILDADMTVPPEELMDFYEAIEHRAAEFAIGTRFLYPMEKQAMRFSNYIGNLMFSALIEIIVGSPCTDTLCGTKAFLKKDFENFKLEDNSWGDFDLIFHAARLKLKWCEIPVHYKSRIAGESKMKAFTAGIQFLKLCLSKWAVLP